MSGKEKDIVVQHISLNKVASAYEAKSNPVITEKDEVGGYIRYSDLETRNDRYTLTLLETIRSSNTATALYNTRARFVAGSGAANIEMGEFIVNPKDDTTLNDMINVLSKDLTKQNQLYIWIKLNKPKSDIFSLDRIAPQNGRLGLPDKSNKVSKVYFSPYVYGSRDARQEGFGKSKSKPFYDKEKRAPNQILYCNFDKEYNEYYPYPLDETQLDLFRTDAQITKFDHNNLKNNFFGGAIINLIGDPNEPIKNGEFDKDTGKALMEKRGDLMAKELGRNKVGADNAGNLTILWSLPTHSDGKSQPPLVVPVESNTQANMFSATSASVTDNIARVVQVPTKLANIQVSGKLGGDTDALLNDIDLLIANTEPERRFIESKLNPLLARIPKFRDKFGDDKLVIQPLSMIRNIPDKIWGALTIKEKRDFIRKNFSIEMSEEDIEEEMVDPKVQEQGEKQVKEAEETIEQKQKS